MWFSLVFILFVIGYSFIILEHKNEINKAASALFVGASCWSAYALGGFEILGSGFSAQWNEFIQAHPAENTVEGARHFIATHQLMEHLSDIASIVFFLLGAMTIVEIIDKYQGFRIVTDRIKTTKKVRLLWIISMLTFFMSALLDNLTTTIVMVTLTSKLLSEKENKWLFAGMVVVAANAGGAWSPIGDVTTIMLWIGGQITTLKIISSVFLPSLVSMIVPLILISVVVRKNETTRPVLEESETKEFTPKKIQVVILVLGALCLLLVPVFKTVTHLPPFLGMLFGVAFMWVFTDRWIVRSNEEDNRKLSVARILNRFDVPTLLFFLGILLAVASLQSAGHLQLSAAWLDKNVSNVYAINLIIGVLSSIVDNVPLVAGAMGMYPVAGPESAGYLANFMVDGHFWSFLAFCAGTGGSVLIIGSAAGVAAMGLENIKFFWYLKNIGWRALIGYLAGAFVYILQASLLG